MNGRYQLLENAQMGRPVHLWSYGHFGLPVLAFPSAGGMAHEWQEKGMIEVLRPWLDTGKIKLYCPESNVAEAWTRVDEHPLAWRLERHAAYERFILETLVPFIRQDCRWADAPIAAVGCSLGATYAVNAALRHPETFRRALGMSGRYLGTELTRGEMSNELYFHSPLHYVPNLQGEALDRVRHNTHITLVVGQGQWEEGCLEETIELGRLLARKGVPSVLDVWGPDVKHDWEWWHRQIVYHFGRMFP
jgi:esterase/lipase superfamily enzyme